MKAKNARNDLTSFQKTEQIECNKYLSEKKDLTCKSIVNQAVKNNYEIQVEAIDINKINHKNRMEAL